jgi:hypothetical protein
MPTVSAIFLRMNRLQPFNPYVAVQGIHGNRLLECLVFHEFKARADEAKILGNDGRRYLLLKTALCHRYSFCSLVDHLRESTIAVKHDAHNRSLKLSGHGSS